MLAIDTITITPDQIDLPNQGKRKTLTLPGQRINYFAQTKYPGAGGKDKSFYHINVPEITDNNGNIIADSNSDATVTINDNKGKKWVLFSIHKAPASVTPNEINSPKSIVVDTAMRCSNTDDGAIKNGDPVAAVKKNVLEEIQQEIGKIIDKGSINNLKEVSSRIATNPTITNSTINSFAYHYEKKNLEKIMEEGGLQPTHPDSTSCAIIAVPLGNAFQALKQIQEKLGGCMISSMAINGIVNALQMHNDVEFSNQQRQDPIEFKLLWLNTSRDTNGDRGERSTMQKVGVKEISKALTSSSIDI